MDYKKLVERLREEPKDSRKAVLSIYDLCVDAAIAIETLLHALDMARRERDAVTRHMIELEQETVTNRNGLNEPLTLAELRKMDGEPVWVVYDEDAGMWALVEVLEESIFLTNNLGGRSEYAADVELEDDGITVYRQKPEGGTV